MKKNILIKAFVSLFLVAAPVSLLAEPWIEIMEMMEPEGQGISIQVVDNVLQVNGAAGQTIQIYNVTGLCVMNMKVDSDSKSYNLNLQRGCYIVKVGKVVRKISLK